MGVPQAVEEFKKFDPTAEPGPYIKIVLIGRPGAISPVIDGLGQLDFISQDSIADQRKGRTGLTTFTLDCHPQHASDVIFVKHNCMVAQIGNHCEVRLKSIQLRPPSGG
jgi:hypothetical protein